MRRSHRRLIQEGTKKGRRPLWPELTRGPQLSGSRGSVTGIQGQSLWDELWCLPGQEQRGLPGQPCGVAGLVPGRVSSPLASLALPEIHELPKTLLIISFFFFFSSN